VAEISLAILVVGVLMIADPERLQKLMDTCASQQPLRVGIMVSPRLESLEAIGSGRWPGLRYRHHSMMRRATGAAAAVAQAQKAKGRQHQQPTARPVPASTPASASATSVTRPGRHEDIEGVARSAFRAGKGVRRLWSRSLSLSSRCDAALGLLDPAATPSRRC
jgi:hypothetical protein